MTPFYARVTFDLIFFEKLAKKGGSTSARLIAIFTCKFVASVHRVQICMQICCKFAANLQVYKHHKKRGYSSDRRSYYINQFMYIHYCTQLIKLLPMQCCESVTIMVHIYGLATHSNWLCNRCMQSVACNIPHCMVLKKWAFYKLKFCFKLVDDRSISQFFYED